MEMGPKDLINQAANKEKEFKYIYKKTWHFDWDIAIINLVKKLIRRKDKHVQKSMGKS